MSAQDTLLLMRQTLNSRQHWTRRIIYTGVIVAAAAGLAWWGSRRETQRHDQIRERILLLCESLADGEAITWQSDWASPAIAQTVMERLQDIAMTIPEGDNEAINFTIAPKGLAPYERGEATHQVLISVYDRPSLGLMFAVASEPENSLIVGWWDPNEP